MAWRDYLWKTGINVKMSLINGLNGKLGQYWKNIVSILLAVTSIIYVPHAKRSGTIWDIGII